jgi:type I restriction enzyme M protein
MILTNPPFGSKVTNERVLKDLAARDGVSKLNGKITKSLPQKFVFVNRCLEFLAPGGKLAIVLPDGVLANSSMQAVRDWILRWSRLKAIVSLPQETFAPYGAGVKTSVVFLEKRAAPLPEADGVEDDYTVFMSRIDNIGYDASGRLSVSEDQSHNPCYAGDYNMHTADSSHIYVAWTDGRIKVDGVNQQDVFFAVH